ncbi:ATP-binding protein [Paraburkholderia domus]|jgi:Signal transduction histidine kinase|uniref:histidine kinase n=1 Tax=Paraburkholderia domus TaxID=2793075 RepID=A0A9N8QTM5_9BURK|nr:ATP-binding protein [Paraburkholderia domus]MBK5047488.1 HAMP domain-containing protein [Burkholderia sp. R-70006]MBK5164100.1 HAMP domain-containing protein [Burkholderia sp. R-70211]CAE6685441.1 Adaptive-response sensory-kinase SasA [Paraburkholderia domus]CAE6853012.1 Adaptive-response sensory-kinase SasA [Paraburkholderia domus]
MLRSLIRLYLIVVIGGGLTIAFINTSFSQLFHERVTQTERGADRTYAFVLEDYLQRHAGPDRAAALAELKKRGSEGFRLMTTDEVEPLVGKRQWRELRDGKLVLDDDTTSYYLPLSDGIVVNARRSEATTVEIQALAYALLALATLLSVIVWVHYHWRELRKLEAAARAFGSGNLSTRALLSKKSNIYELSQQFNEMAQQIEASILNQREMMRGISHELKTPLARLEFGLALLQSPESPERQRERQMALRKDVRELDELVTELLTLSRLEQGEGHLVLMRVSVDELLDSVAASMSNDVADRSLTLSVNTRVPAADADVGRPASGTSAAGAPGSRTPVARTPAYHVCDPKLVARALLNLLRNSTRYAQQTISLSAGAGAAGTLVLIVEDDGPGIPLADRGRVFEPFHRLDCSRDRHTGGFGLGLAIVRRVALVHGGDVRLEEAASGGARFVITLPALPLPMNGSAPQDAARHG